MKRVLIIFTVLMGWNLSAWAENDPYEMYEGTNLYIMANKGQAVIDEVTYNESIAKAMGLKILGLGSRVQIYCELAGTIELTLYATGYIPYKVTLRVIENKKGEIVVYALNITMIPQIETVYANLPVSIDHKCFRLSPYSSFIAIRSEWDAIRKENRYSLV